MAMAESHLEVPESHIISEDWTSDGGTGNEEIP